MDVHMKSNFLTYIFLPLFLFSGCGPSSTKKDTPPTKIITQAKTYEVKINSDLTDKLISTGNNLTFKIINEPINGQLMLNNDSDGSFTYIPDECFIGEDSFSFMVTNENESKSENSKMNVTDTDDLTFFLPLLNKPNAMNSFIDTYQIDEISQNMIVFSSNEGDITDDVFYDRRQDNLNFDGLYQLKSSDGDTTYFRFGWSAFTNDKSKLRHVQWANNKKPKYNEGVFDITLVQKNICQQGDIDVTVIGDSITWYSNGQYFRKLMSQLSNKFRYTGSRTDTFGYGHEGEGGNNSQAVLNRINYIVKSDIYILMIGTNDRYEDIKNTLDNITEITSGLIIKAPSSIVYVSTILPRDDEIDNKNIKTNELIRSWINTNNDHRIKLLDVEKEFRSITNWQHLLSDKLHPTIDGYKKLSEIVNDNIT